MNKSPKVSVLIPSYNLGLFIAQTLDSVLAQDFQDWECIIEDDGSTDNSCDIIAEYVAKDARFAAIVKLTNEGQNKTANNLVAAAHSEYLCCLPADDTIAPDKLSKQVAYLDAHPECGIVFGQPRFINSGGPFKYPQNGIEDIGANSRDGWKERLRGGNCLFIATSMHRRALHDELGKFDEALSMLADLEWYLRILDKHDIHVIEEPLATIRLRDNAANLSAMTPKRAETHSDELEIVRARHFKVDPKKVKFMLATPFYDVKGFSPYIMSLVQTITTLVSAKIPFEYIELSGDSYVWRARNLLAERFMNSDCTHLVFLDSDQSWDVNSFLRLIRADADIVGGAYPTKNNWEHYSVTIHTDENGIPDVNNAGLIRGQKVPTGFMKIKREVFERLRTAYKEDWYWETSGEGMLRKMWNYFGHKIIDHVAYGEDISFCKRCEFLGIKLYVEPRLNINHIGTKTWTGNYHEFLCKQPGGSNDPARNQLKEAA